MGNSRIGRCGLNSPSDSPVPNHGTTSLPSMPHFLETRFYCSILLRLHRSFNVLDLMRPSPSAGGPTRISVVSYILHRLPDKDRRLTQTSCNVFHTMACTRRRTGGCGKSIRIRPLLLSIRTTPTGLISFPAQEQKRPSKYYMVSRYCFSMFQTSA